MARNWWAEGYTGAPTALPIRVVSLTAGDRPGHPIATILAAWRRVHQVKGPRPNALHACLILAACRRETQATPTDRHGP
jgi:hypothetical protein